jgi:probable rRNA maturation factor
MAGEISPGASQYEVEIEVDEVFRLDVHEENLRAAAMATLQYEGIEKGTLTILITDDKTIQGFNRQYRDLDVVTDVLSFATHEGEELTQDLPPELMEEIETYWGDLIIAYPYTVEQAKRYGNTIEAELRLLVVHGTLHLLGYDHDTSEHQTAMWEVQRQILQSLSDESINWERESEA